MQPFLIVKNTDLIFDSQKDCIIHVHIQFQFLTPRIVEKISLSDFLKALSSAAIVVT